ncbi:hypothetical protein LINGRAHAP2_LOCUS2613 [Linum grandiflorum]
MARKDAVAYPIPEETCSNSLFDANSRCCFAFPCCFGSRRPSTSFPPSSPTSSSSPWWEQHRWLSRGFQAIKKVREWSEIVAGPKWKTFIRRFNRNRSGGFSNNHRHGKFQYDPLSYALNFDEGKHQDYDEFDEQGAGFRDFSSRYAANSGSSNPLHMDSRDVKESGAMV